MTDCMTFPDTVEEFMEQYKVVDTKQVYTNGTEFVPIYRMKQWFQHKPERKKGKWYLVKYGIKCSECGGMPYFSSEEPLYKFCPNCGADMRGDDHD